MGMGVGTEALSRDYNAAHCDFIYVNDFNKECFLFALDMHATVVSVLL